MRTTIVSSIKPYITKYALPILSAICLLLLLTVGVLYSENKSLVKEVADVKAISEQNDSLYERGKALQSPAYRAGFSYLCRTLGA